MAVETLPKNNLEWHLYGAGLDNLGDDGKASVVPMPEVGPNELLVRIEACGLCFSDTKVINLGDNHPKLTGRNLKTDPVVLGHEATCTIVKVGDAIKERFKEGVRYIVQADVFFNGKSMAFGYVFKGGLAQYQVLPTEMIDGDAGTYLLPIKTDTGVVEASLVEPWACVVAAYNINYRHNIKDKGKMLIIQASGKADIAELFKAGIPSQILTLGLSGDVEDQLPETEIVDFEGALDWDQIRADYTDGMGFDDILLIGEVPTDVIEAAILQLAYSGVCSISRTTPFDRPIKTDVGRIHYDNWQIVGTTGTDMAKTYKAKRTAELIAGGKAWFIGAGGPMGQMHVQRAVQLPNPPKLVVATDVDGERLETCRERYGALAESRGIKFVTINPKEMTPDEFDAKLKELSGDGFDDVVCMVPVVPVIEHGSKWVGPNGAMNIFAGAARGTIANFELTPVVTKGVQYYGSSGSSMDDMKSALDLMEEGQLQTRASLAAIGGMNAVKEGMEAVIKGRFPGKIVILPHFVELPLMDLDELKGRYPTVYTKLEQGRFWTNDAEQELLRVARDT